MITLQSVRKRAASMPALHICLMRAMAMSYEPYVRSRKEEDGRAKGIDDESTALLAAIPLTFTELAAPERLPPSTSTTSSLFTSILKPRRNARGPIVSRSATI